MSSEVKGIDLGLVITKSPLGSSAVEGALEMAKNATADGLTVGIFLISDGVLLAKRGQKNRAADLFAELVESSGTIVASGDHLEAAGISKDDISDRIVVSGKPYDDLVDYVMERWVKVVSI